MIDKKVTIMNDKKDTTVNDKKGHNCEWQEKVTIANEKMSQL